MNLLAALVLNLVITSFQIAEAPSVPSSQAAPVHPGPQPAAPTLAPDPGRELVQARCTSCHGLSRFAGEHRTSDQWAETVVRMRDYGADVTEEEYPVIVAFLTRTQGPEASH